VVGRALSVGGRPHTIAGIMPNVEPPRFGWLGEQPLWFPFVATNEIARGDASAGHRPAPSGGHLGQARAEMLAIADRRSRQAAANEGWSATVTPLARQITGDGGRRSSSCSAL
jgi:hypothetical protein